MVIHTYSVTAAKLLVSSSLFWVKCARKLRCSSARIAELLCTKRWDVMQVPDLQLGPAARFANDSQLFYPVAALLESPITEQSKAALQVCLSSHWMLPICFCHAERLKESADFSCAELLAMCRH